jgi:hypothetical protein
MQVDGGNATIGSLRQDAREQTQELSKRLEQVIFSAASFYCLYVLYFLSICLPQVGHFWSKSARARTEFLVN